MSLDFQRLERVLAEAAAKGNAEERAAYLAQVCGDDAELRAEVERLLAAHEKAGNFLETPFQPAPEPISGKTMVVSESDIAVERAGARIGRYKLLEEIGEGGFGVVYMAEQIVPVQRKVALKIIKAGMDTREVVARFEAERQALALMDHPNIAHVFDGGATQTGRPYFVMELVRGIAITDFCDQRKLSTRERLQLFIQVCHAVQHAHQKGIIHRDLKPSNILVTLVDGGAVPKIIDFGVAKALGQRLTDKTLFTSFLRMVGTPAYMSPEQADLSGVDIDTRADIYALGVLLYELLTGFTPFDGESLRRAALDEVRRMIRETEPPKPSTRRQALVAADVRRLKSTNNQRPTGEEIRASSRRLLQIKEKIRLVRGDLDWIVMKCLEKDRRRRYETANSLAGDIERHLDHQPVLASTPGTIYRVGKFVRRHRMGVALGASVGAALVLGLVAALVGFAEARRERDHALVAERQAQTEAARSAQVAQFMKDMLKGVGPSVARGRDTTLLREILDQTAERLGELTNQPAVEADLCETLGIVYRDLSEFANAETMLRKSLTLRRNLHESQGGVHADVASSIYNLAEVFRRRWQNPEAEAGFREALTMRRKLFGNEHIKVAASLSGLAGVLRRDQSRYAEAEAAYREVLAIQRKLLGDTHPDVARSLTELGILLRNMPGRLAEAEACLREALKIQRQRLGDEHPDIAGTLQNLGYTISKTPEREAEAELMLRETVAMQKNLLGDHRGTAMSLQFLATIVTNPAEAIQLHREALAMRHRVLRPDNPEIATSVDRLATALAKQGKFTEALTLYREEVKRVRTYLGNADINRWAENTVRFANTLEKFANTLRKQRKFAEAEPLAREALAIRRNLPDGDPRALAKSTHTLGVVLAKQGKVVEAETLGRETLALRKKYLGNDHIE